MLNLPQDRFWFRADGFVGFAGSSPSGHPLDREAGPKFIAGLAHTGMSHTGLLFFAKTIREFLIATATPTPFGRVSFLPTELAALRVGATGMEGVRFEALPNPR